MTDLEPMDVRLRAYADRWRDSAAPPPALPLDGMLSRRPARKTWWIATSAAAVAAAILGGTRIATDDGRSTVAPAGNASPTAPAASPTPTSAPTRTSAPDQAVHADPKVVRAAVAAVEEFLDTWRRDGLAIASRRYLEADAQLPPSSAGLPRLSTGKVVHAEVSSWESPDRFTLEVRLDLHFSGDPMAWNDGDNDRFVTVRRDGAGFRLAFATSP